jgi:starch synthase (maltosyl-transferring)
MNKKNVTGINKERIIIENVNPNVDNGRFAVKSIIGKKIKITADIYKDGHEKLKAVILYKPIKRTKPLYETYRKEFASLLDKDWQEAPLIENVNDEWYGYIICDKIGDWIFTVCAWTDVFATWQEELKKKADSGDDVSSEILEGIQIVEHTINNIKSKNPDLEKLNSFLKILKSKAAISEKISCALDKTFLELMARYDLRLDATLYQPPLPIWVDREKAEFGAWYEIFVRSQGTVPYRSATFKEAEKRLPYIASLGFDVLYLTPIHPIGYSFRRGPNNTDNAGPNAPGSCWAIGSKEGGHTSIHPDLGTIKDFEHYLETAKSLGLEIAMDFAIQCSPDHPWVTTHPEWFKKRPDGSIKYAENPPKKYKDIYPINFDTQNIEGLYNELLNIIIFWIKKGVKIFRVDNPHTKPFYFWEWLIFNVHKEYPDVIFLSEAFTRPKKMYRLAKLGFTQSYTYFTWRNSKYELESYSKELFCSPVRNYFRPNFFTNTPDILHAYLQDGGRPAFIVRLILAATLSPSYGIYSGFELCENKALKPGSEEYLDSEKYQIKIRDWDVSGNIKNIVRRINDIRKENPALQTADNLYILESTCPDIIAYAKISHEKNNKIIVIINLDPHNIREGTIGIPKDLLGNINYSSYYVKDILNNEQYLWSEYWNYVKLDPNNKPAHIFKIES